MRTIIFDLDGVLWSRDFSLLGHLVCINLKVPPQFQNYFADKITQAIYSIPSIDERVTKALVVDKLSCIPILDAKSVFEEIRNPSFLYAKINTQALPVVRSLYKKGYHLTCRSNWFRSVQLAELGRSGMLQYFDNSKIFGMLGEFFKPHPNSLDSIVCGKVPSQFVIVGDTLKKEVLLGNMLGIETIWLNETGQKISENKMLQPTYEISQLEELLQIL